MNKIEIFFVILFLIMIKTTAAPFSRSPYAIKHIIPNESHVFLNDPYFQSKPKNYHQVLYFPY